MSFTLPALPYAHEALEPHFDTLTMQIHHGKHHQAYVDNLNKAIAGTANEGKSLEELVKNNFNILQINKLNKIKNDNKDVLSDTDTDSNSDNDLDDDLDNDLLNIKQEDIIDKFKLRENQTLARQNNIKNNFGSGIHNQVTGAGKSLLMMLTINDHYQKNILLYLLKYLLFHLCFQNCIECYKNYFYLIYKKSF